MRYAKIKYLDTANGPGIRTSIFTNGCGIKCEGCQNFDIQDYKGGSPWTSEQHDEVILSLADEHNAGLSILGGEPFSPMNREPLIELCKAIRKIYGDSKTIWLWTGYYYEDIVKTGKWEGLLKYLDVIVDSPFEQANHSLKIKWRGSSNQRIIKVQESLKEGKVVLHEDMDYGV